MENSNDSVSNKDLCRLYASQNRAPTPESYGVMRGSDCLDMLEMLFCDCNCCWCTWGLIICGFFAWNGGYCH